MPINIAKQVDWARIAARILDEEERMSQGAAFGNELRFTSWGIAMAKSIGVPNSAFWKYRRCGVFYRLARAAYPELGLKPLAETSGLDAEQLNELAKIGRAAPDTMQRELLERVVVKKDITRKELRAVWASLRPALGGATARGRRPNRSFTLKVDLDDATTQAQLRSGLALIAIKERLTKLFASSEAPTMLDLREFRPQEAIAAYVLCGAGPRKTEIHGLCFMPERLAGLPAKPLLACDCCWLICLHDPGDDLVAMVATLPDWAGVLAVEFAPDSGEVAVIHKLREAPTGRIEHDHQNTIDLLARAYHTKGKY